MHFNTMKNKSSSSSSSRRSAFEPACESTTSSYTLASFLITKPVSSSSSSSTSVLASSESKKPRGHKFRRSYINFYGLLIFFVIFLAHYPEFGECRYLPTRSRGDQLDKLRELMLEILETSNENIPVMDYNPKSNRAQRAGWLPVDEATNTLDADSLRPRYPLNGRYYY